MLANEAAKLFGDEIDGAKREEVLVGLAEIIAPGHVEALLRASEGEIGAAFDLPGTLGAEWRMSLREKKDRTWTCSLKRPIEIDEIGNVTRPGAKATAEGCPDAASAIVRAYLMAATRSECPEFDKAGPYPRFSAKASGVAGMRRVMRGDEIVGLAMRHINRLWGPYSLEGKSLGPAKSENPAGVAVWFLGEHLKERGGEG